MDKFNAIGNHSYVADNVRIAADRKLTASVEKLEMLRGFGFSCTHEYHAGFWLIHYQFPKLKLVIGHVLHA